MRSHWHPDGVLYHRILSEPIFGELVPAKNHCTNFVSPQFLWLLIRWASDDEFVFREWKNNAHLAGKLVAWTLSRSLVG